LVRAPKNARARPAEKIRVIGHRGAPCQAAENTIESFETALRLGADAVEADVCITRDRELVVWHDADPDEKIALARQAGREKLLFVPDAPDVGSPWRRPVRELDLARLREHYGYVSREGDGDRQRRVPIATLGELLDWSRARSPERVYLDLKFAADQREEARFLLRTVRAAREAASDGTEFHLLSPQREIVQTLLAAARAEPLPSGIRLYADFERPGVLEVARRLGVRCVGMGRRGRLWGTYRRELARVLAARAGGKIERVVAWTINDREEQATLVRMRVPAMLTDEIELLRGIVDGRSARTADS
jgi:glycerophosphoryl diester phosphodiesterase